MMYADETMVSPQNKFLFPEILINRDFNGKSQPALSYRAVRQGRSFTRRQAMELDRMGSSSSIRATILIRCYPRDISAHPR